MSLLIFDMSGTLIDGYGRLFDGAREMLDTAREQGHQLALATQLSRGGIDLFIEGEGLEGYFVSTKSAQESAYKPDPEMLALILLEADCAPEHAVMIGDTASDIYMAHYAGVKACAVGWDGGFSPELIQAQPHLKVERLSDLLDSLNALMAHP